MSKTPEQALASRRYRWPWFVAAAALLGLLLAVLWMSHEVERTRQRRPWTAPAPATNFSPAPH